MFFRGPRLPFGTHDIQGVDESRPGFARRDDGVNIPSLGGLVWIRKEGFVFLDFLLPLGVRILGLFNLAAVDNIAAPAAPMTAISAVGQAKAISAPKSLEHMAR